jgi:hypothetical protein
MVDPVVAAENWRVHEARLAPDIGAPYTRGRLKSQIEIGRVPMGRCGCSRGRLWVVILIVLTMGSIGCVGPGKRLGRKPMNYRVPPQKATVGKAAQVYTLVAGFDGAHNHFPGPDGLVGTVDDLVSAYISPNFGSDANFRGSLSFVAGTVPGIPPDPSYFPGLHNGASFCEGTVTIDDVVAAGGGGPLILDWSLVGTAPVQAQGASFLEILTVNGGTYDPVTKAISLDYSPQLTTGGQVLSEPSIISNGTATVLDAPFPPTGNVYIDNVLVPLAIARGADSLFFAQLDTTVPGAVTIETDAVLVGFRNATSVTDLALATSVNPPSGSTPSSSVTVTLTASNNGALAATNTETTVFMPPGLTWTSGSCGGPPVSGEIVWSIGNLPSGGSTQCSFTSTINAGTPFDLEFGASLFMDQMDSAPDDNFAPITVEVVSGGDEGLDQVVAFSPGLLPSDADCDLCSSGAQAVAGNFKVNGSLNITNVTFFGVYTDNNAFSDQFTVAVHGDSGRGLAPRSPSVPGSVVATLVGTPARTATGNLLYGFYNEYRYTLAASQSLTRGRYWLAVYNDSSSAGGTGDWVWLTGDPDAMGRSLPSMAAGAAAPPTIRWGINPDPATHMAFNFTAGAAPQGAAIPVLTPSMLGVFGLLVGILGVGLLRRRLF